MVKVGLDIIDWSYLKCVYKGLCWDFGLMIMVFVLMVFVDLIIVVGVGVVFVVLVYVK